MSEQQRIGWNTKIKNYFCWCLRRFIFSFPFFITLIFCGALFWAKAQDPFSRHWFTLKTDDHNSVKCVTVLPKPLRQCPVIIYVHSFGGSLMNDGNDLRQMAEIGFAAVSLEYDQTNEAAFDSQFETLLRYLGQQRWSDTNAISWVGFSLGANRMLNFALKHSGQQPRLFVQLGGAGIELSATDSQPLINLHCPILLIHGEQDEIFPIADTKHLASVLKTNGLAVDLKIIPNVSHGMEPERGVIFRSIGEYCFARMVGKDAWKNYHSIAQWQAEAPALWLFWLPAMTWLGAWFAWRWGNKIRMAKIPLTRYETILHWLAALLSIWALAVTALHLLPPRFPVNDTTLNLAQKYLVQPKERADFEYLAAQPIWHGQKLKTLLEHVQLANYNRTLINWQLDDKIYQEYVLSPVIELSTATNGYAATERQAERSVPLRPDSQLSTLQLATAFNWRRPLWEEFYPRIRHETSPADTARIVVRHLRERVTVAALPNPPRNVSTIWLRQITDEAGFQIIYVATLRSVGVPARLNSNHQAEFYDGNQWQTAPSPAVTAGQP